MMRLFEPITIRGLTFKNRIVMPGMELGLSLQERQAIAFYTERARGEVGTIITAATSPNAFTSDDFWGRPGGTREFREGVCALPREVHEAGGKIGVQLLHMNRLPDKGPLRPEGEPVAPSARIEGYPPTGSGFLLKTGDRVREITIQEIEAIISGFGRAAVAVKDAGFDFVELHLAHGYFTGQFFSPFYNRRNDKYGGDLLRRMQFGLECARTIRCAVGDDYPIFCRFGVEEKRPGGVTLSDSTEFAIQLVEAGIDVLDISIAEGVPHIAPTTDYPMGTFVHLAEAIKHRVNVPVIAVGRINTAEVAEDILAKGRADIVAIGRQLIADPFWPLKVKEGRGDEIRPCLSCNKCISTTGLRCAVNPAASREEEFRIVPVSQPKRVWIVGGGPGGMEAARIAAMRGHDVTLFEKKDSLGGQLFLAATVSDKDVIAKLANYLIGQVKRAGVKVRLNSEVTAESVADGRPDVVVLAMGTTPLIPDIPGVDRENVVLAGDVLSRKIAVGDRVVIIGGELVACDTALFLAEQGKRVTIVRRGRAIALKTVLLVRYLLVDKLSSRGVKTLTGVKYERITEKGLDIVNKEGKKQTLEADTIVLAAGAKPNNKLAQELLGRVSALYSIGDCVEPRSILEAIAEGDRTGLEI